MVNGRPALVGVRPATGAGKISSPTGEVLAAQRVNSEDGAGIEGLAVLDNLVSYNVAGHGAGY